MRHFTNVHDLGDLKAAVKEFKPVLDLRENHTDAIPDTNTWGRIKP